MAEVRPTERRRAALRRRRLGGRWYRRARSTHGSGPSSVRIRGQADDRLLTALRRHRGWTALGLTVAAVAALTRFVSIGIIPPSIEMKPFAHANANTSVALGEARPFALGAPQRLGYRKPDPYGALSPRAYALADMVDSPEITEYVARAAGVPASKIGVLGPLWTDLWRSQQWASGPKRASQIVIENRPYHITINQEANQPPGTPVIDVYTQAPTTEIAARLARAVPAGLSAYVQHAQAAADVPARGRYNVTQIAPVSVAPARTSQLASVAAFTFLAVFVLWCGAEIAVSSIVRDLRATAAASKVGPRSDRLSDNGALAGDPADATT